MKIAFLDNITGFGERDWQQQWVIAWFLCGCAALGVGFWQGTAHGGLDWFYLAVSIVGLLCVVGLSFRKNIAGNGLGMLATAGEVIVQATAGSVGLMLAPLFNFFSHAYGTYYWAKNTDGDGDMLPKSANRTVWLVTIAFVVAGLMLFEPINARLAAAGVEIISDDGARFLGISFFWINIIAFVLSIAAQMTMILRYSFNWYIWIAVNAVWLVVNLMTGNIIFAIQTLVYQINAVVGLYGWYRAQRG